MRVAIVAMTAVIASFALAPAASATDRYAAPTEMGTHDCMTPADACTLADAENMSDLQSDTVLVRADLGPYNLDTPLEVDHDITVRGFNGRPRLVFSGDGLSMTSTGSTVRNL